MKVIYNIAWSYVTYGAPLSPPGLRGATEHLLYYFYNKCRSLLKTSPWPYSPHSYLEHIILRLALNHNTAHAVLSVVGKVLLQVPLQQRFSAS